MKLKHLLRSGSAVALMLAASGAGCVDTDNRPATLEYITETILKPSCGTVNCHSSLGNTADLAFDSVAAARLTFTNFSSPGFVLSVMKRKGSEPMPPNDIVPDKDLELIQAWIDAGTPGL